MRYQHVGSEGSENKAGCGLALEALAKAFGVFEGLENL